MPNLLIGIGLMAYAVYGLAFTSTTGGIQPDGMPTGFALASIGSAALLGVIFVICGIRHGLASSAR